jgi:hypothetical protein
MPLRQIRREGVSDDSTGVRVPQGCARALSDTGLHEAGPGMSGAALFPDTIAS